MYSSLILPYLNYGLLIWGGSCKKDSFYRKLDKGPMKNNMNSLTKIHKLQKRALRIISKVVFHYHHIPLCSSLNVLDLEQLYDIKALCFFYDNYHDKLPPFFANKLTLTHNRNDELCIKIKYKRTDIAATNIFQTLPDIWNPLPNNLKKLITKSKKTFKSNIKNYFLSLYENWVCTENDCFICAKRITVNGSLFLSNSISLAKI